MRYLQKLDQINWPIWEKTMTERVILATHGPTGIAVWIAILVIYLITGVALGWFDEETLAAFPILFGFGIVLYLAVFWRLWWGVVGLFFSILGGIGEIVTCSLKPKT